MPAALRHCWMISTRLPDDERALRADPDLVEKWVMGWTVARQTPSPVRDSGAYRIDVGLPDHKMRYVFDRCSEDIRRLAKRISEPNVFIKVCSPPEPVLALLPLRWENQTLGYMMTRALEPASEPLMPKGYRLVFESSPPRLHAVISDAKGALVARGGAALVDGLAVFDQIRTHEAHRRRGLARAVMTVLQRGALVLGIRQGALVATPEGRALYDAMGWKLHCLYTRLAIPA